MRLEEAASKVDFLRKLETALEALGRGLRESEPKRSELERGFELIHAPLSGIHGAERLCAEALAWRDCLASSPQSTVSPPLVQVFLKALGLFSVASRRLAEGREIAEGVFQGMERCRALVARSAVAVGTLPATAMPSSAPDLPRPSSAHQYLRMFLEDRAGDLRWVEALLERSDEEFYSERRSLFHRAHTIKGNALMVGVPAVAQKASALESLLAQESPPSVADLRNACMSLLDAWMMLIPGHQKVEEPNSPALVPKQDSFVIFEWRGELWRIPAERVDEICFRPALHVFPGACASRSRYYLRHLGRVVPVFTSELTSEADLPWVILVRMDAYQSYGVAVRDVRSVVEGSSWADKTREFGRETNLEEAA